MMGQFTSETCRHACQVPVNSAKTLPRTPLSFQQWLRNLTALSGPIFKQLIDLSSYPLQLMKEAICRQSMTGLEPMNSIKKESNHAEELHVNIETEIPRHVLSDDIESYTLRSGGARKYA